jgi:chitinase
MPSLLACRGLGLALPLASLLGLAGACGSSGTGGSTTSASSTAASAGSGGTSTASAGSGGTSTASTGSGGATTAASSTGSGGATTAASSGSTSSSATTTSSSAGTSSSSSGGTTTGQWVMGYYVGYAINQYPIAQIDWSGLTHIIFSPMILKSDLSLDLSFSDSNGTGMQDAQALSAAAHAHGVKALLMLGGAGAGGNIATAASAAHRAAFVTALTGALGTLGYDGIDLDWEDSVNLPDLVALAQALRAAQPGMLLSYPAGSINANYQTVDPQMAALAQSLDRFNVQTYYPSTAFAGQGWDSWFNSPISGEAGATPIAIDDTLGRYVTAGIPKAKIGLGMSFYAICYTGGITGPRQPTNGTTQVITGGDNAYPLSKFFAAGSTFDKSTAAQRHVDAVAQAPYLSLPTAITDSGCGTQPTQYLSYEDETSIVAKGTWSKANGYGGIIIWQLAEGWLPANASGGRAQNAMMQALKTGFIDP